MLNITQILLSAFIGSISTLVVQFFLRNEDKKYKANLLRLENVYSKFHKIRNTASIDDLNYYADLLDILHTGFCYLDNKSQTLVARLYRDVFVYGSGRDFNQSDQIAMDELIKICDSEYDKISKKLKLYKS